MARVLSERDYELLQEMVTWWQRNKNNQPQFRRRNISVPQGLGSQVKIFKVQSEATGDGIYNCYEQTLDATEWDDTAGDPKFDNANTTSIEVLNLAENNPRSTYVAHLAAGDLIAAWQKMDDENNKRWAGIPFRASDADRGRIAFCDGAPTGKTISAFLDRDTTGTSITVYTMVAQSGEMPNNTFDMDDVSPLLSDGDPIMVHKVRFYDGSQNRDYWICDTVFQSVLKPCVCVEP